ncbi:uncharacterized protein GGS25DRAFT_485236 [Hypoxylon fragiforme]|uniref:uncharacterized protein n=1 Tax=Hypoxylon fragiforme TaxID=63214 RepID=UPI0020C69586|nr:uncharacterized protein GGS25DRAFT_485236 [Hypoxylon fragiforme]KAI2609547.1 hypothetical protein GGS25DRAFT_485236 [Hypoxylon fragiforme]
MSLGVAFQSAVFYVVSCAPCLQARHHQQSKAKAKKEREEKARIQAENPGTYQHPDPFNTNPYWSEEIMMGPRMEPKNKKHKTTSQKRLHSSGKESTSAGSSTMVNSMSPGSSHNTVVADMGDVADDGKLSFSPSLSDDWNRRRYQREDEELWGNNRTGHKLMDAIKQAGSSAGRLLEASLGKEPKQVTPEERHDFYFAPRNPPVNEYHPPIVRQKPAHRDANKWMLQPPPAAKIMEGKVPVSRSGSMASHVSRRTATSDGTNLGRLVHERTVEAKLRNGESPAFFDSTTTLHKTITRKNTVSSRKHRLSRSRSLSIGSEASDAPRRRRSHRARQQVPADFDSSDDESYFLQSSDSFGRGRRVARQPTLQPISSSQENDRDSKENVPASGAPLERTPTPTQTASSALADITNSSNATRADQTATTIGFGTEPYKTSSITLGPPLSVS